MALGIWAQSRVSSAFNEYSKVRTTSNLTGAEVARHILDSAQIHDVDVVQIDGMLGDHYDELMARRAKATPLKRCVTADDVAETMMSLIQGNRFVTGEIIVIDGGFASST